MNLLQRLLRVILWGNKHYADTYYKKYGYRTILGLNGWIAVPQFIGLSIGTITATALLYLLIALKLLPAYLFDMVFIAFLLVGAVLGSIVALTITFLRNEKKMQQENLSQHPK